MKDKVTIRDANPPLFFNLLASIAIVVFIVLIYKSITIPDFKADHGWKQWSGLVFGAIIVLTYGLKLVLVQQLKIDLKKRAYQKGFGIGPFSIGIWKKLPRADYISFFRQPLKNGKFNFELNIWYDNIHHIELFYFNDSEDGFNAARQVARHLKVTLLDARIPNETKEILFKD